MLNALLILGFESTTILIYGDAFCVVIFSYVCLVLLHCVIMFRYEIINFLQILVEWKSRLRSWGYEPVLCSVDTKRGLDTLKFILRDKTSVIVGPSGVGKSSLINALRGNRHVPGAAEDDNWFEPVG